MYKRFEIQSPPTTKTYWCLGLTIKSYYQEWTTFVETLLKKKKKKEEEEEERLKSREIVNKGGKNTNSLKEKEEHNSDSVF